MRRGIARALRTGAALTCTLFLAVACQSAADAPHAERERAPEASRAAAPAGWRDLEAVARDAGYALSVSHTSEKRTLEKGASRIEIDAASRVCYFDGRLVIADAAPVSSSGRVWISPATAHRIEKHAATPATRPVAKGRKPTSGRRSLQGVKVVVDAGHGGKDPGANRGPSTEKAINLGVATELARILRAQGAEVVMTRATDRFISLDERAAISNRERPDAFISIHVNAARSDSARGLEIYRATHRGGGHRRDKLAESSRLANAVYAHLEDVSPARDRGVKPSPGWRVLKKNAHPAILVELGFISNPAERHMLEDGGYQAKLAAAIARGVADYAGAGLRGPTAHAGF